MDNLTDMLKKIQIDQPNEILLQVVNHDFDNLTKLLFMADTIYIIKPPFLAFQRHYLTTENCIIIYNYLSNNYIGYNLLKDKVTEYSTITKSYMSLSDTDIQSHVDYYLDNLALVFSD